LSFLPQVDQIWMLENGVIEEAGSYEELRKKNGLFSEFIKNYLAANEVNKDKNGIYYVFCLLFYFIILFHVRNFMVYLADESLNQETPNEKVSPVVNGSIPSEKKAQQVVATTANNEKAGEKIVVAEKIESGNVIQNLFSILIV
jgi:hypothetical protein